MGRIAVVLFNLGGPDAPEAVGPFLFNLFNDPAIIGLPSLLRYPLAQLVARRRAPTATAIYAHLGGGSPLLANTEAQAGALQAALADVGEVRVFCCMRYWHPMSDAVAAAVKAFDPAEIVLLPLYPQFSSTTTGSSAKAWHAAAARIGLSKPTKLVCCYPMEPGFIAAAAELVRDGLAQAKRAGGREPRLLFSAHGLPMKIVRKGDPYVGQVGRSARAVAARLNLPEGAWRVCFQSRVGPVEWVKPYTDAEIAAAGREGVPIVLFPISFVSEHSETLVELDIEYRRLGEESGVPAYIRVATVGTSPAFIDGLARLVHAALADPAPIRSEAEHRICAPAEACCPLPAA
ncbi:MAG TPA: ferrochelatase [Dongiaceae bacterium]|nr:ferrochelatase [Dongiaceae bacterium]